MYDNVQQYLNKKTKKAIYLKTMKMKTIFFKTNAKTSISENNNLEKRKDLQYLKKC